MSHRHHHHHHKEKKIHRFPRLIQRFPRLAEVSADRDLTSLERFEKRIKEGEVPRGYDRLSRKQKKVAKAIASGLSIKASCEKYGVLEDTFYRWRRAHKLFKSYLQRRVIANLNEVDHKLDHQILRAAQIVEEGMENPDIYLRSSLAEKVLRGRKKWQTSTQTTQKTEHTGNIGVGGQIKVVDDQGMTKDMMETLVNALVQVTGGAPRKVIDIGDGSKALPQHDETEDAGGPAASTGS